MVLNFTNPKTIISAPMAGLSDSPARRISRRFGADMTVSGLLSSEALVRDCRTTLELAKFDNRERPIGLQLFGSSPHVMAEAARALSSLQPDFIDLNFGCPARKVVGKNGGSSVLKDLRLLEDIVGAVVKAVGSPVTVKMRSGWDDNSVVFLEAGRAVENAGAGAITLHPRTKMQRFGGVSDWKQIELLKKAVGIPVIGNGDISTPQDAVRMFTETGCDAIMIGRAATGNPWIFTRVRHYIDTGELLPGPSAAQKIELALEHLDLMTERFGVPGGVYKMRSQFCWYLKGIPGAASVKSEINRLLSPDDIRALLYNFRGQLDVQARDERIALGIAHPIA